MATLTPIRWPRFVTGSTWENVLESIWNVPLKARSIVKVPLVDPSTKNVVDTPFPRLTNGDVIRVTMGYLAAVAGQRDAFPLWAQFAATAYAWDPEKRSEKRGKLFDTSNARRDAAYPTPMLVEFLSALQSATRELVFDQVPNPRVDLDGDFGDVVFQGEVAAELKKDGAASTTGFRMPVGCKTKDGKVSPTPQCTERMSEWPYLCTKWTCDRVDIDIDPVREVKRQATHAFRLLLLILGAWLVFDNKPRPRRRN